MSFQLSERVIKSLCGQTSYRKGMAYCRAGKVSITRMGIDASSCEASVKGADSGLYRVTVQATATNRVEAACTCPSLTSYDNYCTHVAAVLIYIYELERSGELRRSAAGSGDARSGGGNAGESAADGDATRESAADGDATRESAAVSEAADGDAKLVSGMLQLFQDKPPAFSSGSRPLFDTRELLDVQFTVCADVHRYRLPMFTVELKAGPQRLYTVPNVRDFLDRLYRREAYAFTGRFTYEPQLHRFRGEDDAVLQQLIRISQSENLYREPLGAAAARAGRTSRDRSLPVPPALWESLLPALLAAPSVQLELDGRTSGGIFLSEEPLPLQFDLDRMPAGQEAYELRVQGLERLTVMEAYGLVLAEGRLYPLPAASCARLSGLKRMLEAAGKSRLHIPADQAESFVHKVLPALTRLGAVRIGRAVENRIMRPPLIAKLYLDRVKDRLLAGLEFQYGDIVFNPLEEGTVRLRSEGRILMRDAEQEARIMELMEQSTFVRTESGYLIDEEEAQFEFLHRIVPQLERLLHVYATSAVKARLFIANAPPRITVRADERTDWMEVRFDLSGIPEAHIRSVLGSLEEKRKYYRLPNGALMPLEGAELQEIVRVMNETGVRAADVTGAEARLPLVRALALMDAEQQTGGAVRLGKSVRKLLDDMRNPDLLDFPVPERLAPVLRDYQKYGFQWLKTLAHYRFGGILADDMGLGKTVQSIAFLVSVLPELRAEQGRPALIVCPASLLYNWLSECAKFAPELRVAVADGSVAERRRTWRSVQTHADVLVTSYPLLRKDIEWYAAQSFHTLILDEAQAVKNYTTQTAQAVKTLQARHRFALTGTPVENSLEELWALFDAVFPGLFPDRKAFLDLPRETIARRVRPFLLRRLKRDVLQELPDKIESLLSSELLPEQKKLYAAYLAKLRAEALKHLDKDTLDKGRIQILAGLTRLRQICCHPALFVAGYTGSSGKFEQLLELIDDCRSAGRRMLVFSQFTEMLGLIRRELGMRDVPHFYLDGHTPSLERVELCDKFNDGERDVFLISLKAGGTGLNLTGADTVILYDLWWNPAVEQQAADRAYRIGQTNVVQVIRLAARGTVEDKMYELQQRKTQLIEEVIRPGEEPLSAITEQDLRELLML